MSIDPITAVLEVGSKVIDRLWPDPTQAAQAKIELYKLQQAGELAQITGQLEINKVEAASSNWFVSGPRPFVLWVCGFGLAYQILIKPLTNGVLAYLGHGALMPDLDTSTLMTLMSGILGLGAYRSYEKVTGVA
jgi:hypothetical protein